MTVSEEYREGEKGVEAERSSEALAVGHEAFVVDVRLEVAQEVVVLPQRHLQ